MDGMLTALKATAVPPRFVEADGLLRDALAKNITGLELRNESIATSDDVLWQQHTQALQVAQQAWAAAYAAFPEDHRPPLTP